MGKVEGQKILTHQINYEGYHTVSLEYNGEKFTKKVHRLMAERFLKNPENKPNVCFKNGDKNDLRIENLEWSTHKESNTRKVKNSEEKKERIIRNIESPVTMIDSKNPN